MKIYRISQAEDYFGDDTDIVEDATRETWGIYTRKYLESHREEFIAEVCGDATHLNDEEFLAKYKRIKLDMHKFLRKTLDGGRMNEFCSRRTDPWPQWCSDCKEYFPGKDWGHGYVSDGAGDSEAMDFCPKCGERQY